jgi:PAS domain-containing protein
MFDMRPHFVRQILQAWFGRHARDPLYYAERIIATIREPFLVFDESLQVKAANRSFYQTFRLTQDDTEGVSIYDLGDGQWNRPDLRALLDQVQLGSQAFRDCYVKHNFPTIGKRTMRLNARRLEPSNGRPGLLIGQKYRRRVDAGRTSARVWGFAQFL